MADLAHKYFYSAWIPNFSSWNNKPCWLLLAYFSPTKSPYKSTLSLHLIDLQIKSIYERKRVKRIHFFLHCQLLLSFVFTKSCLFDSKRLTFISQHHILAVNIIYWPCLSSDLMIYILDIRFTLGGITKLSFWGVGISFTTLLSTCFRLARIF